jgi:hypothetical protein
MKSKSKILFIILLLTIIISGCKDKQEEIHIVPHHFNLKAYTYETYVDLAFVTTYKIEAIENVSLLFSDESLGGIDGIDVGKYYEVKQYKTYSIFVIRLVLKNVQGDIRIDSIKYDLNNTFFQFDTDIRVQNEYQKDVHFFSGDGSGAVIIPGFADYGYSQVLASSSTVEITNVYFEGTGNFELNAYILNVSINDNIIEEKMVVHENDPFYLQIVIKNSIPRDIMIIDQIAIEYKEIDGETSKFGYVLVPLSLYSVEICSQNYIDSILKEGR